MKKASKYNNIKTTRKVGKETYEFDSRKEALEFDRLLFLAKAGKIKNLMLQPKFLLLDTLRVDGHRTFQKRYYIADFRYTDENGVDTVIDVKSSITKKNSTYTLKKHLFLAKYGKDLVFIER